MKQQFDREKAIEVLLYVARKSPNIYNILKVIYFADKEHLAHYGRLLYGDNYLAMSHGPVPSGAYDVIKYARGDTGLSESLSFDPEFLVKGYHVFPCRNADIEALSESELECLDLAIAKYGDLSFHVLKTLSHQEVAYQTADENDAMPVETIIKSLPDSETLLDYVRNG